MQGTPSQLRQIRKEATARRRFLCRSVPGLPGAVFLSTATKIVEKKDENPQDFYGFSLFLSICTVP